MRLTYFGGPAWDAGPLPVRGRGQETLLFRLALDAGTVVSARALSEDIWPLDAPADPRAALQSLVSRVRRALGPDMLEAVSGGYRLALSREDVDLTRFADLVAEARRRESAEPAREALHLWTGDPWIPEGFDWALRDLLEDRAHARRLAAGAGRTAAPTGLGQSGVGVAASEAAPTTSAIPAPLTALVGRADELAAIAAQLGADRLVTLLGPGGAGKTTLALEIARRAEDALFVELAPAAATEIWAVVAGAAGRGIRLGDTAPRPQETDRDRVLEALRGRAVLLVLDNCEHVSAAAAAVAIEMLTALPGVRILATSREPLGVPGEAFVDLGPLPTADAVELFSRRVRSARGAAPSPDDGPTVERIVRRLDGLPLALELAAAKARTLTLAEIDAGLDDRFALLGAGPRAADPRHQTLRALIDWSWEPLPDDERTALLAASVFPDGVGADDAPAVGDAFGTEADAFDRLVDRSLLSRVDGRFRMLETVREYGIDRLRRDGGERGARVAAAEVLAELATRQDGRLRGPEVRAALAWFDANDESLTAALRLTWSDPELHEVGVRLARATVWPAFMRERFADLRTSVETLARTDGVPASEAAVVVDALLLALPAFTAPLDDDISPEEVEAFVRRAAEIAEGARRHPSDLSLTLGALVLSAARALQDGRGRRLRSWNIVVRDDELVGAPPWTIAFLAVLRAAAAQNNGDVTTLGDESARGLALFEDLGDPWGLALASQMRSEWLILQGRVEEALTISDAATAALAGLTSAWDVIQQRALALGILVRLGRIDEALARLEDVRRLAETEGSSRAIFQFHSTAATLAIAAGDAEAALDHLDSMPLMDLGGPQAQLHAWAASRRAQALLALGRPVEARDSLRAALPLAYASGDHPIIADLVAVIALWLIDAGRTDTAARAFAASVRLRGGADETDPLFVRLSGTLGAPDLGLPLSGDRRVPDAAPVPHDEDDEDPEILAAFLD